MAKQGSFFVRFRNFDAYAKTLDDFRVKTTAGATGKNKSMTPLTWIVTHWPF